MGLLKSSKVSFLLIDAHRGETVELKNLVSVARTIEKE